MNAEPNAKGLKPGRYFGHWQNHVIIWTWAGVKYRARTSLHSGVLGEGVVGVTFRVDKSKLIESSIVKD